MTSDVDKKFDEAADWILNSNYAIAFTGAGISVESGIPPFRGDGGLWSTYDPRCIEIGYFLSNPVESWTKIREIFFDFMGQAKPNPAHLGLAYMEDHGHLKWTITQNIDFLHQQAGSINVTEFHGSIGSLHCLACSREVPVQNLKWEPFPPQCPSCEGLLKPNFIFFGEAIPEEAMQTSMNQVTKSDLMILIGTTGEVMPAAMLPPNAKQQGAKIIEINVEPSRYTSEITDLFLQGKAGYIMEQIISRLG